MKTIKYSLCTLVNHGTEEKPQWEEILFPVSMGWNEENEAVAKAEAYNGKYIVEDNGEPEAEEALTPEERIAELEEALALLLAGVTE